MALDSNKEIQERLLEAGCRLLQPPSSVDELLAVLDQLEDCLSKVPQSPPHAIQSALSPVLKALIADNLLRHTNVDVKVALASSISEITRISAPNAPYDDDQMKEAFQLIVSSFEDFSDKESRSFNKRISILETVAKVRSCVVMLDLECDTLIVQMFHYFLKCIRDYLPEGIFTCMETIMVLVVDESEDVSLELLTPILASLKNDTEEFLPTARRLSEKVVQSCVTKLKPYLIEAVKSLGIDLEDYSDVLASICVENSGSVVEHDDGHVSSANQNADEVGSHKEVGANEDTSLMAVDADNGLSLREADPPEYDRSLKVVISNGNKQQLVDAPLLDSDTLKQNNSQLEIVNMALKSDEPSADSEVKMDQTRERRGRKPKLVVKSTEPSRSSPVHGGNVSGKHSKTTSGNLSEKHPKTASGITRHEKPSIAQTAQLENETTPQESSPKGSYSEAKNLGSLIECGTAVDESNSRKTGRPKKKDTTNEGAKPLQVNIENKTDLPSVPIQTGNALGESYKKSRGKKKSETPIPEAKPSIDDQIKLSAEASDSGLKRSKRVRKKKGGSFPEEEKAPLAKAFKKQIELSKSDGKPSRISEKKLNLGNNSDVEIKLNDLGDKPLMLSEGRASLKRQSGKKLISSNNSEAEIKLNDLGDKSYGKKENFMMKSEGGSSERLQQYKKRRGRKLKKPEDGLKSSAEVAEKVVIALPKVAKPIKDEEIANLSSKRKRVPEKDKVLNAKGFHGDLIGYHIEVFWPDDEMFYSGVIDAFDPVQKKHKVLYDDGDQEILDLKEEKWNFIEPKILPAAAGEPQPGLTSPDPSSPMQQKKKAKTSSAQGRGSNSSKSGTKSKASQPKGLLKSTPNKSMEDATKKADSEDTTSDRSIDVGTKSSKKPKSALKTPKTTVEAIDGANSKGDESFKKTTPKKTPQSGSKVGSGSGSWKKKSDEVEEKVEKEMEGGGKSGKKRRRR